MMAVLRGHKHIVKIFVDLGVRLDAIECNNNNTALHLACLNGEKDIVEMLATE
jgi:ankyrin repeat protein